MEKDEVIKIRNRFLRLLKENNLLSAYVRNFNYDCSLQKDERCVDYDVSNVYELFDIKRHIDTLIACLSADGDDVFLNYAFLWENTPEGYACWKDLNNTWKYKVYDCCDDEAILRDYKLYLVDDN